MADFSVSQALGAGFSIIRRKPLTVAVWGLVYFAIAVVPMLLVMGMAAPAFLDAMRSAASGGRPSELDPATMAAIMGPMTMLQPVIMLSSIAAQAIVMNAVFRATLEPENDGLFYLRLGGVELWQGLVQFTLQILLGFILAVVIMFVAFAGLMVGVAVMSSGVREFQPWMVIAGALALLFVVGFAVWLILRFSMAGPMTFADQTFRLFESWTLTRGRVGSLFLLALLIALVLLLCQAVVITLVAMLVLLVAGGTAALADTTALSALFAQSPSALIASLGGVFVFVFLVVSILAGFAFAITLAPWADAYRQLTAGGEEAAPPVEATVQSA